MSQCDFHRERNEHAVATTRVVIDCPDQPRTQHLCDECVETYSNAIRANFGAIDPRDVPAVNRTRTLNRFIEKVEFPDEDIVEECWEWGASTTTGYPQFRWGGGVGYGHRYAVAAVYGDVPDGDDPEEVMHECNNSLCVNPSHLWIGTGDQNVQHAVETTGMGQSRLIDEDAEKEIQRRYENEDVTQVELGDEYNVCSTVISKITRGEYR